MTAPIAITAASVPVNPPPDELEPGLVTTGAEGAEGVAGDVVAGAVGVGVDDCGNPGESGLPEPGLGEPEPWACPVAGVASATDSPHATATVARQKVRVGRPRAFGRPRAQLDRPRVQ